MLFALIPYLLVSWAYMAFVNGDASQFWRAFAALYAARLFFSVIDTIGDALAWRLHGKKLMTEKFLLILRANNFPKREYAHDDFTNYLARIGDLSNFSTSVSASAKEIYLLLSTFEGIGIFPGARMHAATEAALDVYSPKSEATGKLVGRDI